MGREFLQCCFLRYSSGMSVCWHECYFQNLALWIKDLRWPKHQSCKMLPCPAILLAPTFVPLDLQRALVPTASKPSRRSCGSWNGSQGPQGPQLRQQSHHQASKIHPALSKETTSQNIPNQIYIYTCDIWLYIRYTVIRFYIYIWLINLWLHTYIHIYIYIYKYHSNIYHSIVFYTIL